MEWNKTANNLYGNVKLKKKSNSHPEIGILKAGSFFKQYLIEQPSFLPLFFDCPR